MLETARRGETERARVSFVGAQFDANGDGELQFTEFCAIWAPQESQTTGETSSPKTGGASSKASFAPGSFKAGGPSKPDLKKSSQSFKEKKPPGPPGVLKRVASSASFKTSTSPSSFKKKAEFAAESHATDEDSTSASSQTAGSASSFKKGGPGGPGELEADAWTRELDHREEAMMRKPALKKTAQSFKEPASKPPQEPSVTTSGGASPPSVLMRAASSGSLKKAAAAVKMGVKLGGGPGKRSESAGSVIDELGDEGGTTTRSSQAETKGRRHRRSSEAGAEIDLKKVLRSTDKIEQTMATLLAQASDADARAARAVEESGFEGRLGAALLKNEKTRSAMERVFGAVGGSSHKPLLDLIRSWDRNGDGMISKSEMRQIVRNDLGMKATNAEIDTMFDTFDADGGGELDPQEMRPWLISLRAAATKTRKEIQTLEAFATESRDLAASNRAAIETMAEAEATEALCRDMRERPSIEFRALDKLRRRHGTNLGQWCKEFIADGEGCVEVQPFVAGFKKNSITSLEGTNLQTELETWFAAEALRQGIATRVRLTDTLREAVNIVARQAEEEKRALRNLAELRKDAHSQQVEIVAKEKMHFESLAEFEAARAKAADASRAAREAAEKAKQDARQTQRASRAAERAAFEESVAKKREGNAKQTRGAGLGLENARVSRMRGSSIGSSRASADNGSSRASADHESSRAADVDEVRA